MKKALLFSLVLVFAILTLGNAAYAGQYSQLYVNLANDGGPKYHFDNTGAAIPSPSSSDPYWVDFNNGAGKGLNSTYISTSDNNTGQNTALSTNGNSSLSGTFYVNDTSAKGKPDELVMISVSGPIYNDFSVTINSSGWNFAGTPNKDATAQTYVFNALHETFTQADLTYGPQGYKFGWAAGAPAAAGLPFYYNQSSGLTQEFMLVDLYAGASPSAAPPAGGTHGVKVDYTITGLYLSDILAFNAYGFTVGAPAGNGIAWTNDPAISSYMIASNAAPVPIPPTLFLLASGLGGLCFVRRKKVKRLG